MFDSGTPARAAQGFFGALLPFFASPELPWRPSRVRREPISPPTRAVANRRAWRLELRPTPLPPSVSPASGRPSAVRARLLGPPCPKGTRSHGSYSQSLAPRLKLMDIIIQAMHIVMV
jgi:hypothetical protein